MKYTHEELEELKNNPYIAFFIDVVSEQNGFYNDESVNEVIENYGEKLLEGELYEPLYEELGGYASLFFDKNASNEYELYGGYLYDLGIESGRLTEDSYEARFILANLEKYGGYHMVNNLDSSFYQLPYNNGYLMVTI